LAKDLKQVIGVIFYILLVYLYMCSLTKQQWGEINAYAIPSRVFKFCMFIGV
jgi:hypothetical protein